MVSTPAVSPLLLYLRPAVWLQKRYVHISLYWYTIKNVVARYIHRKTPVLACFLDASKAFDLVNHDLLFQLLLDRGMPVCVVRLLRNWYVDQKLSVRWNSKSSYSFNVSNGVRQGGVLSPVLFTIYIDKLLLELRQQGVGCYWNSYFAGAYAYAYDLAILAPSASALRRTLRCCESFASLHGLKFNPGKSQLIKFSAHAAGPSTLPSINFCGIPLGFSNTVVHLGNILSSDLNDSEDILSKCRDMLTKSNALLCCFPNLDPVILTNLFQSYCLSLHGSALWNISSRSLQTVEVSFNKVLRRIWKLPRASHTAVVHCTAHLHSLLNQVLQRSYKLLCSAEKCSSDIVRAIFKHSSELCYSSVGYKKLAGVKFAKSYTEADVEIGTIIRNIRSGLSTVVSR